VSNSTTTIIIESAWFDQAVIRRSGKRLGIRTDALNVFEKDLVSSIRDTGTSLIIKELEAHLPDIQLVSFTDVYPEPTHAAEIDFNLTHINSLIGRQYSRETVLNILDSIFVVLNSDTLEIPLWRKDLTNIADIAEEIARLDGYDKVEMTVPRINLGAITQNPLYMAKREIRNFLVSK
jgi:phenylalanyl-tRNA synthetase beta chain